MTYFVELCYLEFGTRVNRYLIPKLEQQQQVTKDQGNKNWWTWSFV